MGNKGLCGEASNYDYQMSTIATETSPQNQMGLATLQRERNRR